MPRRYTSFLTGNFYHIFNKSVYGQPILQKKNDLNYFLQATKYYLQLNPPIKFSYFRLNPDKYQTDFNKRLVTLISYCFMPNHFHFCLKQEKDGGIQLFMRKLMSSFSHYFQIKYKNKGPLFCGTFKAVPIESDEQLMHLSRYHHLNPVTAGMVDHPKDYHYSSFNSYMTKESDMVDTSYVLSNFSSKQQYERFVLDRKDYQKELKKIEHLINKFPGLL